MLELLLHQSMMCTTDWVLHTEFKKVLGLSKLAYSLSLQLQKVTVTLKIEFWIVTAVSMRLRGSTKQIKSIPLEDTTAIFT